MIKEERFKVILEKLEEQGFVKVSCLNDLLNVSEMTIRRDLVELEKNGSLVRVHGGARKLSDKKGHELSHYQKQQINIDEKIIIAKKIAACIEEDDIIFLGAGTTIELVPNYLKQNQLKIITNSLPIFNKLLYDERYETILIGGTYRSLTGAFFGSITNSTMEKIRTNKAFIGVNAINGNIITNYSEEEGRTQKIILDNAFDKYIIADSSKLNSFDFYHFYNLEEATGLITDSDITEEDIRKYQEITKIY